MSECHLAHKIPWDNLKNCLITDKTQIFLPVGICDRIHCEKRSTEIKVKNRKFIKTDEICREENCETVGEKKFSKNKNQPPNLHLTTKVLDDKQCKQLKYFCEEFAKTVFEFIKTEENRTDNDVCYTALEHDRLSSFIDPNIPCTECYGKCTRNEICENFVVFNLFIEGKIETLLALHKLERVDIVRALSKNYGGQAVGNGFSFLMDYHILPFYLTANMIIACKFENDSSKWGTLNIDGTYNLYTNIQSDCDYKTFIPTLRHLLNKDIFIKDADSTRTLLKECFRSIYNYARLKKIFFKFTEKDLCEQLITELRYTFSIQNGSTINF